MNVVRADIDNDGDLDVALLRGGWEASMRLSLLRNKGDGTFEDITIAAGMAEPIATEAAAWGDYNNDGLVDLFVCGEYLAPFGGATGGTPDPRNRSRLYRNKGDGTFEDVAVAAGVAEEGCSKGCAWGDFDGDGKLELFVSNLEVTWPSDGEKQTLHDLAVGQSIVITEGQEGFQTLERGTVGSSRP